MNIVIMKYIVMWILFCFLNQNCSSTVFMQFVVWKIPVCMKYLDNIVQNIKSSVHGKSRRQKKYDFNMNKFSFLAMYMYLQYIYTCSLCVCWDLHAGCFYGTILVKIMFMMKNSIQINLNSKCFNTPIMVEKKNAIIWIQSKYFPDRL